MTSYTNVFGNGTLYPSDTSLIALALTADVALTWPLETSSGAYIFADVIDVTPNAGGRVITLPEADEGSTGAAALFNNLSGSYSFAVEDADGGAVATIAPGEQWTIYLADNSDAAGTWRSSQLGASTASVQASDLVGYGLTSSSNLLSTAMPVTSFASSPRTVLTTDRARVLVWTGGGSATVNLPAVATAANDFFFVIRNGGGGNVTLDPSGSEEINGDTSLILSPGDSAIVLTDGSEWFTVGYGRDATFAFDFTSIDLTGETSPYTLSSTELNRIAYEFTGTLTANMEIVVPSTVQQYWVSNTTSGAYTLGLRTSGQSPAENVTQSAQGILYCNGTDVIPASATTAALPSTVPPSQGGTGITSYAVGDLLYASASNVLSKLADVATGNALISGGVTTAPAWGKIALTTHVSGTLPVANGGTGITSFGTGVATALGVNVGSAGAFVTHGGALGTPSSGTLTNCTGLPISTGVSGLGSNVGTFLATASSANLAAAVSDETGTGALVFANTPTLVTPVLGTPGSGTLTNCTGLPVSTGITGFGTGVATALAVNVGSAGAFVALNGALGTPSSGALTNCTGLPISTGVSGLGSNVGAFLATASSANLAAAVSDETGSGALVFANTPTLVTPVLGTPGSGTLTNCTGLPISTGVSGLGTGIATFLATPSSANLRSALTDETGTGAAVFATTPTLVTPVLGAATGTSLALGGATLGSHAISATGSIADSYGNLRTVPQSGSAKTTSYQLATTDVGQFVQVGASGSITIPDATFAAGDIVSVFNNTAGNITITCSITTAYIAGVDSDKATVTLATRGVATILFISGTVCVISGSVS